MRELEVTAQQQAYVGELQREILKRLEFLEQVGLGYLALNRRRAARFPAGRCSAFAWPRRSARDSRACFMCLDEPSIGLHPTDNERSSARCMRLRDLGNTVLVVEHDEAMMRAADHLIELGPAAGVHGGHLIAQGHAWKRSSRIRNSLTGQFLSGNTRIDGGIG
jgi:excinuclease ABC subunit A